MNFSQKQWCIDMAENFKSINDKLFCWWFHLIQTKIAFMNEYQLQDELLS